MFKKLWNFSFQRTGLQALGFYIVWLVLIIFCSGLICGIAATIHSLLVGSLPNGYQQGYQHGYQQGFAFGKRIAPFIGVLACALLGHLIVQSKGIGTVGNRLLVFLAGVLAFFGGSILGLIPVAFLTTRQSVKVTDLVGEAHSL